MEVARRCARRVYTEARSEEVAPGMRSAVSKACAVLDVASFVYDLDRDVCDDNEEALGSVSGAAAGNLFRRFGSLRELLAPRIALPIRDNFWALKGRRVRQLSLSGPQSRVVSS